MGFRKKKHSKIKFHEIPSSGSRVIPCGLQADGQTDVTKLSVASLNFANAHKNCIIYEA